MMLLTRPVRRKAGAPAKHDYAETARAKRVCAVCGEAPCLRLGPTGDGYCKRHTGAAWDEMAKRVKRDA